MKDKYTRMREDISKMKLSYGNRFPMTFHPDTILELLDDLADLTELNERQIEELGKFRAAEEAKKAPNRAVEPFSEQVDTQVATDPVKAVEAVFAAKGKKAKSA